MFKLNNDGEFDLTPIINFTKSYETFRKEPYEVNGQTLIGYGSANPNLISKQTITEEEASREVENKYNYLLNIAKNQIPNWENLSNGVKYAMLDVMYNGGEQSILSKSPNLMKMLNEGITDGTQLSKELDHSKSAGGWLGVRSAARRAMAQDKYDWDWQETDKYGRQIDSSKYIGEEDWKASPYYQNYQKGGLIYTPFFQKIINKRFNKELEKEPISSDLFLNVDQTKFPVEPVKIYKPVQVDNTRVEKPIMEDIIVENQPEASTKGKIYLSSEKELFKSDMYNAFLKALKSRNVKNPEEFAKRLTTQTILESNWGQSSLSEYYNFGGIKDFSGNGIQKDTTEYINGKMTGMPQPFRKFKNLDEFINYKLDLVGNKWNVFNYNPDQYFNLIVSGKQKYATDPNYTNKLNNLYKRIW